MCCPVFGFEENLRYRRVQLTSEFLAHLKNPILVQSSSGNWGLNCTKRFEEGFQEPEFKTALERFPHVLKMS